MLFSSFNELKRAHATSNKDKLISLVPSLTELFIDLGFNVVGRTEYCIYPEDKVKSIPVIGGTKNIDLDQIDKLKPDWIIANKEENKRKPVTQLSQNLPVLLTDIGSVQDLFLLLDEIGRSDSDLKFKTNKIKNSFDRSRSSKTRNVIYFIWKDPFMVAGGDTYISSVLAYCGYENVLKDELRYPILKEDQMAGLKPDKVLLSSEPYAFTEKHIKEFKGYFPDSEIELVNGEFYSWYGSRIFHLEDDSY